MATQATPPAARKARLSRLAGMPQTVPTARRRARSVQQEDEKGRDPDDNPKDPHASRAYLWPGGSWGSGWMGLQNNTDMDHDQVVGWFDHHLRGGPQTVGIIASVTRPFCGDCDRVRLTADGQVRDCLFARTESDLRTALRSGADDEELADRWRRAMRNKLPGHGINDPSFLQPTRPMSAIGG